MIPRLLARLSLITLALFASAFAAESKPSQAVMVHPYPEGFRQWRQVKTTTLDPKDPLTAKRTDAHFVYANEAALEGLRSGQYPEGAIFVLDIFIVKKKDGVATLGECVSTSTMVRDPKFAETGGWAFVDFDVATHKSLPETNPGPDCYQCHTQKSDHSYVFTELHF